MNAKEKDGAQTVYLSDAAQRVLAGQKGMNERIVFPSTVGRDGPMNHEIFRLLLDRMNDGREGLDRWTDPESGRDAVPHGFRSSFSCWANEIGAARPDAIEAALAHQEAGAVRRAYMRAAFLAERGALMTAWSAYVDREAARSNVIARDFRPQPIAA